jgi:hypothetical protein
MLKRIFLSGLVAVAAAAPAAAATWQTQDVFDPYGAAKIQRGQYDGVEKKLAQAYARGDRSIEVLLNLAAIRAQEQNTLAAHSLYREVLAQPNADMLTLTGTAWSHDIAQRGISDAVMAAR